MNKFKKTGYHISILKYTHSSMGHNYYNVPEMSSIENIIDIFTTISRIKRYIYKSK